MPPASSGSRWLPSKPTADGASPASTSVPPPPRPPDFGPEGSNVQQAELTPAAVVQILGLGSSGAAGAGPLPPHRDAAAKRRFPARPAAHPALAARPTARGGL